MSTILSVSKFMYRAIELCNITESMVIFLLQ